MGQHVSYRTVKVDGLSIFYDYRTNVDAYPKWQEWMRAKQARLLVTSTDTVDL